MKEASARPYLRVSGLLFKLQTESLYKVSRKVGRMVKRIDQRLNFILEEKKQF